MEIVLAAVQLFTESEPELIRSKILSAISSDLAIQTDGKIVAAGYSLAAPDNWRTADFAVVRYNPDGSLDTSFGGTGTILIPVSYSRY